jgi:hypothetical protein
MSAEAGFFRSDASGVWRFEAEGAAPDCQFGQPGNPLCGYGAEGINGVWTRVPGPPTLALLGAGLTGLAFEGKIATDCQELGDDGA